MDQPALQSEHKIRNLQALLEVSKAMGHEVTLDKLLQLILNKATEVMDADRSSLFLYDAKNQELWSKIAQGLKVKEIRFPVGIGIAGDVAKTLKPANIPDAYDDSRFNPAFDKANNYRTKTVLCLPMIGMEGELVGVIQVLNKKSEGPFNKDDEELLEALGSHAAVALQRAQLIEVYVESQRMDEALKLAHNIQMSMLPKVFPPFPEYADKIDIYAGIDPAKDVGGDLYDFFMIDDKHLCFAVGDVSGKGVPAALFMAVSKTMLKTISSQELKPSEVMVKMNDSLSVDNEADMFITFFCGLLNIETGDISFSNGGHNPPYLLKNDGTAAFLDTPVGTALGVIDGLEFEHCKTHIDKGEAIYLYTDGVNEAMDIDGNQFSYEKLDELLTDNVKASSETLVKLSHSEVKKFAGEAEQSDDITVLVIRRL